MDSLCSPLTPDVRWLEHPVAHKTLLLASVLAAAMGRVAAAPPAVTPTPPVDLVPTPPAGRARLSKPLFKGVELYSWQQAGTWCFSLLPGTNRNKEPSEVRHPTAAICSVALLKARLATLAPGELVFWETGGEYASCPAPLREELTRYCASIGIVLR